MWKPPGNNIKIYSHKFILSCNNMEYYKYIITFIIVIVIIYFIAQWNGTETMASDGGALIQLQAKGPMDQYLTTGTGKYLYPPYYYNVRPKRVYRGYYPYYPYWPYWPYFARPYF